MKKYLVISEDQLNEMSLYMKNIVNNKWSLFLVIAITILFFAVGFFTYKKYIYPKIYKKYVANKEFSYNDSNDKIMMMWFYTDWCPWCTKTQKEWDLFKEKIQKMDYDVEINFQEIDCEKNPEIADKYNIEEYPTIKLLYKNDVYLYDANPDINNLIKFLNGSLPLWSKYSTSAFSKKNVKKDIENIGDGVKDTVETVLGI
tara:strand:+ start:3711 stop:4313 length:603 start_codon:yes stop_codon:yes gene_type:complete